MKRTAWIYAGAGIIALILAAIAWEAWTSPSLSLNAVSTGLSSRTESMPTLFKGIAPMMDQKVVTNGFIPAPQTAGQTAAETDQKIIKTGSLDLAVVRVDETVTKLQSLATGKGGYVENASVNERDDGTKFGSLTIRVPSKEFESTVAEAKKLAALVKSESTAGQDITEQYTDLEAQLRNAQAQEQEYLNILKKAQTVQDILNVQQYLGNIRGTIESLQGRIRYLSNLTSYSTLSITLSEDARVQAPSKGFRPLEDIRAAARALVLVAEAVLTFLIWLTIVGGGILLTLAAFAYLAFLLIRLIIRRIRSNRR